MASLKGATVSKIKNSRVSNRGYQAKHINENLLRIDWGVFRILCLVFGNRPWHACLFNWLQIQNTIHEIPNTKHKTLFHLNNTISFQPFSN
jgi:hypothetical protein